MRRLVLIRHASTDAVRRAAFAADERLDAGGEASARALAGRVGRGETLCSPARAARETAAALGVDGAAVDGLAPWSVGAWAGRSLTDIAAEDPSGAQAWRSDPASSPHGGESLEALAARVGRWLRGEATKDGRAIAVTHAEIVKAAVVRALGAPLEAFWRIDAAPLRMTELHARDGRWTVSCVNAAVDG